MPQWTSYMDKTKAKSIIHESSHSHTHPLFKEKESSISKQVPVTIGSPNTEHLTPACCTTLVAHPKYNNQEGTPRVRFLPRHPPWSPQRPLERERHLRRMPSSSSTVVADSVNRLIITAHPGTYCSHCPKDVQRPQRRLPTHFEHLITDGIRVESSTTLPPPWKKYAVRSVFFYRNNTKKKSVPVIGMKLCTR